MTNNSYSGSNFENSNQVLRATIFGLFFGIVFLPIWDALTSVIFVGWGTGWRNFYAIFEVGIASLWDLTPHRIYRVFPFLILAVFLRTFAMYIWKKPPYFFVLIFAFACLLPVFLEISRSVDWEYYYRLGGQAAVILWSVLIIIKWAVLWMAVWFISHSVVKR